MSNHAPRKRKEPDGSAPLPPLTAKPEPAAAGSRLLAGYMAHEFLSAGTLLGQRWASDAGAAVPAEDAARPTAYADVALLLKVDGAHIPGVVNPTQLARWLQL